MSKHFAFIKQFCRILLFSLCDAKGFSTQPLHLHPQPSFVSVVYAADESGKHNPKVTVLAIDLLGGSIGSQGMRVKAFQLRWKEPHHLPAHP